MQDRNYSRQLCNRKQKKRIRVFVLPRSRKNSSARRTCSKDALRFVQLEGSLLLLRTNAKANPFCQCGRLQTTMDPSITRVTHRETADSRVPAGRPSLSQ